MRAIKAGREGRQACEHSERKDAHELASTGSIGGKDKHRHGTSRSAKGNRVCINSLGAGRAACDRPSACGARLHGEGPACAQFWLCCGPFSGAAMQRKTAQDFDQALLILFDAYVHGRWTGAAFWRGRSALRSVA
ncbi:hypothetical protein [Roseateles oligotrophus]